MQPSGKPSTKSNASTKRYRRGVSARCSIGIGLGITQSDLYLIGDDSRRPLATNGLMAWIDSDDGKEYIVR